MPWFVKMKNSVVLTIKTQENENETTEINNSIFFLKPYHVERRLFIPFSISDECRKLICRILAL